MYPLKSRETTKPIVYFYTRSILSRFCFMFSIFFPVTGFDMEEFRILLLCSFEFSNCVVDLFHVRLCLYTLLGSYVVIISTACDVDFNW